ncbi:hypothetical protein K504DRAFT_503390 [Pleomassaria siparia CBS 279.74]|uniref:Uncharacterized protein n=1 Tax=Pleomassaria siparia CBS 279.74 TaxID=1314801 RepID=A0A6G1K6P9_9PLEO|nr:hypothetical protein K504DRAFT_503390 [Pleomassaria siparia CBS 279.74]
MRAWSEEQDTAIQLSLRRHTTLTFIADYDKNTYAIRTKPARKSLSKWISYSTLQRSFMTLSYNPNKVPLQSRIMAAPVPPSTPQISFNHLGSTYSHLERVGNLILRQLHKRMQSRNLFGKQAEEHRIISVILLHSRAKGSNSSLRSVQSPSTEDRKSR